MNYAFLVLTLLGSDTASMEDYLFGNQQQIQQSIELAGINLKRAEIASVTAVAFSILGVVLLYNDIREADLAFSTAIGAQGLGIFFRFRAGMMLDHGKARIIKH